MFRARGNAVNIACESRHKKINIRPKKTPTNPAHTLMTNRRPGKRTMRRSGRNARTARRARRVPSPAFPGMKLTVDTTTMKKSRIRHGDAKYDDWSPKKPRAMSYSRGRAEGETESDKLSTRQTTPDRLKSTCKIISQPKITRIVTSLP